MMLSYSGIYQIRNLLDGSLYVGSAVTLAKRRNVHWHLLRKAKHDCIHLQRAWDKYGAEAFAFEPLFACPHADLIYFEQRAIDMLRPRYNIARTAGNNLGTTKSPEARAKMRAAKLGKKRPEGWKISEAARERIRRANLGRKASAETREKQRLSHLGQVPANKGKPGKSPPNKGTGLTYEGSSIAEWARALRLSKNTLYERMRRYGMTLEEAINYGR